MRTNLVIGRAAIVGADGFIGRHLSQRLAAVPNLDLILIGRAFAGDFLARHCPEARLVQADMASSEASAACAGADTVVDLAASESPQSLAGYTSGEIAALAASHCAFYQRLARCGVRQIIMLSSGGTVYGPSEAPEIAEDHHTRPISGYGMYKLDVETELDAAAKSAGFGHAILRPANCYGPGQVVKRRQGLMAAIVHCYQSGQPLKVAGDGTIIRDYVHVEDVVGAIVRTVEAKLGSGERLNIGSGRGTSILDLIDLFAAIAGRRVAVEFGPGHDFDLPRNVLDIRKAARLLGWSPQVGLKTGIERLLRESS